jgi:hypothetical protein
VGVTFATATCPNGTKVISGGYNASQVNGNYVCIPTTSMMQNNSWLVAWASEATGCQFWTVQATAICCTP